jgi:hypothetical protein
VGQGNSLMARVLSDGYGMGTCLCWRAQSGTRRRPGRTM